MPVRFACRSVGLALRPSTTSSTGATADPGTSSRTCEQPADRATPRCATSASQNAPADFATARRLANGDLEILRTKKGSRAGWDEIGLILRPVGAPRGGPGG